MLTCKTKQNNTYCFSTAHTKKKRKLIVPKCKQHNPAIKENKKNNNSCWEKDIKIYNKVESELTKLIIKTKNQIQEHCKKYSQIKQIPIKKTKLLQLIINNNTFKILF